MHSKMAWVALAAGCGWFGCESACAPLPDVRQDAGGLDAGTGAVDAGPDAGGPCDPVEVLPGEANVRLVMLVDVSGSLQFVDPTGRRRDAMRAVAGHYADVADSHIMALGVGLRPWGEPVFMPAADFLVPGWVLASDVQTDLEGTLAALRAALLDDVNNLSPADRARTFYEVVLMSDGAPTPRCCEANAETVGALGPLADECPNNNLPEASPDAVYCQGLQELALCNDAAFLSNLRTTYEEDAGPQVLPGFAVGDDRNRSEGLRAEVAAMRADVEAAGAVRFRFHAGHLVSSELPAGLDPFAGIDACTLKSILLGLAEAGAGRYDQLDTADEFDVVPLITDCAG